MAATTPKKRHRSFSASKRTEELEPITFDLEGEEFTALPKIPGAYLLDFMAEAGDDGTAAAGAILPFIEKALGEDEWARFEKVINDPDIAVEIETLVEIVGYLVESYADSRPSEAS